MLAAMSLPHKREAKLEGRGKTLHNNLAESYITRGARGTRATCEKLVKEEEAILGLIRMVVQTRRGKGVMEPITIKSVKRFKQLLGIESLATREGRIYWRYPDELRANLEAIGIDAETGVCVDKGKFLIGLRGIEQEESNRLGAKYASQEVEVRRLAMREVLQRWRPTKRPAVQGVGQYLENQVLNTRIASELRAKMEEE